MDYTKKQKDETLDHNWNAGIYLSTLRKVDTLNQWDLRCFPNPTSDLLIIKSSKEIKSIDFFDINGREIKPTGMPNECYSLSDLPSGWVFLLVESVDGFIEKKNVYKQ